MFDITDISEDKLFNLMRTVDIEFMEIALIDRDEGLIDEFHVHDWFDISFVLKGPVTYKIDNSIYKVSDGEVIIVRPGKYHKEISNPENDFEILFLCVRFTRNGEPIDIIDYLNISEVTKVSNLREIYGIFESVLHEVTYREEGYLLKINAQIYNMFVVLYRDNYVIKKESDSIKSINTFRKNKVVDDIKEYLEMNYNKKISLNELSEVFFFSPQYISSIFKKQTGYSLVKYLNKIRISKAKEMLMRGEEDICKIAENVGISDIHYFYKVFKQFENKRLQNI